MRPSFHCATAWPFAAAYCSEFKPAFTSPARSAAVPDRNASTAAALGSEAEAAGGGSSTLTGATPLCELPSNADPEPMGSASAPSAKAATAMRLNVRIARRLGVRARVRDGAKTRRPDLLGVFPNIAGGELGRRRLPTRLACLELGMRELDLERAALGVEPNDIAVLDERDWSTDRGFGTHMADAETPGRAREAPVGDQGNLATHALPVKSGGGGQHLTHTRAPARTFVPNDEDVAFLVGPVLDGLKARFFSVKAARRT